MNLSSYTDKNKGKKGRSSSIDLGTMIYGRVPPQAKDLEESVLGALMLEAGVSMDVRMILKPEDFYVEAHQRIFAAICALEDKGQGIDIHTVAEELTMKDELEIVGGRYYIVKLTNSVVSNAHAIQHSRIIKQYSVARKLIKFSGEVIGAAYEGIDPLILLREAEDLFFQINTEIEDTRIVSTDNIAFQLAQKYMSPQKLTPEEEEAKYLYTGMYDWDKINGPLFCGGVYVIAARPAMGKTAHAIQLLINMAKKVPVGLVNVEMTDEQLAKRVVSNLARFDNYTYKKRAEEWTKEEGMHFYAGLQEFINLKLHIESTTSDIDRVIQKIKFWVKKMGVRAVVIDYLQIMKVSDELAKYMTETQVINYILEKIRACAKELDIPIFLLSQLNRELYRRAGNKEPNLGDLKGSGKIEEIAFQISFLHRPEYYDEAAIVDEMGESIKGLCYQIVAKHRDGVTDRIKHKFVPQYTRFETWEATEAYVPIVKDEDMPF